MPRRRHTGFLLRIAQLLTGFLHAALAVPATKASVTLECPHVLATNVVAEKHSGWLIYSNDPLRLTGANIEFYANNEDAILDPDKTTHLGDENLSVVQTFRLAEHRDIKKPSLVCHYGVHAQLSRELPLGTVECKVVQHQRFGPNEFEFEASCR